MSEYPKKVTIEVTAKGYTVSVSGSCGNEMYSERHKMESAGCSRRIDGGSEPFDDPVISDFGDLPEAIDDLSFAPFDIAQALFRLGLDFDEHEPAPHNRLRKSS